MAAWEDIIQDGSYGGVTFDFVSARDEHSNTIDEQAFPNRPGQRNQPKARNAARFRVLAIFIEDDYPSTMNKLIVQLDDGGVPKEFIHPIFGSLQASCKGFTVNHDAEDAIDSATVEIEFVEHTVSTALTQATDTTAAHTNAVDSASTSAQTSLGSFLAATPDLDATTLAAISGGIAAASALGDNLGANGEGLSALEVQSWVNAVLSQLEVQVELLADYDSTEQYELAESLLALAAEVAAFGRDLVEAKPPLTTFVVKADTNLLSFVHTLYGSSDRADEVLALNSIPEPSLMPAGMQVRAYAS